MDNIKLIDWEKVLLVVNQMSIIRVYSTIIASIDDEYTWYSNKESRARIEWRWQIAESTVKYAIGKLVKSGLISVVTRGVYRINKEYLKVGQLTTY